MGLHPSPGLNDAAAAAAVGAYAARLPLTPTERDALLGAALPAPDAREGLRALHAALANAKPSARPAFDSIAARLRMALEALTGTSREGLGTDLQGHARLVSMPPLHRTSMAPRSWMGNPFARKSEGVGPYRPRAPRAGWARAAAVRRVVLLGLVTVQSLIATYAMAEVLPYKGTRVLEIAVLVVFTILFGWISAGFWTALAGFGLLVSGRDRHAITRGGLQPLPDDARTALVVPICNEDVDRVFAGLRATCESLVTAGECARFDVFILSDTGDADARVAEVDAWMQLRRALQGRIGVHYRWRQHHIKRKSGNVADFCRRWGRDYRYMVVLDADSVMTGECLVKLARLMEANPGAGIIQTAPRAFGRDALFARVLQFATAAYGPLFTAGLHFWQLGEAHYWGHNAILRVQPFMDHCALGRLPGDGALSGEILSHDFVEAALMRRAGWGVWIAYDLPGSYEEVPPNLPDELARDRRWCLGNLMNLRLFRLEGVHPAHRAVFMIGVMSYLSAPLWFLSLALGTLLLAQHTVIDTAYFTEPHQLFPTWPEWHPEQAMALFGSTAIVLFLPKVLAAGWIVLRERKAFGRGLRATLSIVLESVLSALFAPIRMLFHTEFVVTGIAGITVRWKSPPRTDAAVTWGRAIRRHAWNTVLGLTWMGLVWWMEPRVLPWVLPVAGALVLSIPLSVFSSRVSLGRAARALGLFVTPEEIAPPREIVRTMELTATPVARPGLLTAVVDPLVNALACAQGTPREHAADVALRSRAELVDKALTRGLGALDPKERSRLLADPLALSELHVEAWASPRAHPSYVAACAAVARTGLAPAQALAGR